MGLAERLGFWRRVGRWLNTEYGRRTLEAARGFVNWTGGLATPRLSADIPFTRYHGPLSGTRLAVVTTAGLYMEGDEPFDVDRAEGDPSFRVLPSDLDPLRLRVAHTHYTHRYFDEDHNVILPFDRLRELAAAGVFRLAPRFFSFGFGGTLTREYVDRDTGTAHAVARALREDGADAVLLVPA